MKKISWFAAPKKGAPIFTPVKLPTKKSVRKIPKKNLTWPQAVKRYPKVKMFGDADKDGKLNMFDCKPFDKTRHSARGPNFNREKRNKWLKAYREQPSVKLKRIEYSQRPDVLERREQNREKRMEYQKAYLKTPKGIEKQKMYREQNREKRMEYQKAYLKTPKGIEKQKVHREKQLADYHEVQDLLKELKEVDVPFEDYELKESTKAILEDDTEDNSEGDYEKY